LFFNKFSAARNAPQDFPSFSFSGSLFGPAMPLAHRFSQDFPSFAYSDSFG